MKYSLSQNNIGNEGMSMLMNTLMNCDISIQVLDISRNQIGNEIMELVGEFIASSHTVEQLNLCWNEINDEGLRLLSWSLIGNTSLKLLNLTGNKAITIESEGSLIELASKTCLIEIHLGDTQIIERDVNYFTGLFYTPIEDRLIPIQSKSKSAAKLS